MNNKYLKNRKDYIICNVQRPCTCQTQDRQQTAVTIAVNIPSSVLYDLKSLLILFLGKYYIQLILASNW